MAIVDANLVMHMPKSLTAFGGLDAIVHALEAYVSVLASEYLMDKLASFNAVKRIFASKLSKWVKGSDCP